MKTFGDRLKACLGERNTSQAELARHAGITSASVSEWVNDKVRPDNVKAEPLLKAAAFLGVRPLWLLVGRGPRALDAASVLQIAEPQPRPYVGWPFETIELDQLLKLRPNELARIEGAWLLAARQLGFSLAKRGSA